MKFSVVLSLYNKQAFVRRALESVLCQSYSDFELIVIDDGSTDGSLSVVRGIASNDARVRIISQANAGPGMARNAGVREARYSWVALIDADDAWRSDHLAEIARLISDFPHARIVTTRLQEAHTGDNGHTRMQPAGDVLRRGQVDYFHESALRSDFIHSSSVAIAREVFETVGYFSSHPRGEDQELWARVCLAYPCAASSAATAYYYRGTGGIMEQLWEKNRTERLEPPASLSDLTRAVAYLALRLPSLKSERPQVYVSVAEYINARVTIALRVHLYSGNVHSLFHISSLYLRPFDRRTRYWRAVVRNTPPVFLKGFYRGRQLAKFGYQLSNGVASRIKSVTRS
ncbi:glycosyltransferase family 2 protein [Salinisphaera japonica]|uniref:Glycosyltransferase n=1 Tax=Salinisphaera japonica YTM-1 TaxID=1209778 RepID=A0A423PL96_9GAMM|nr:glycosyltransferase family A protein [Salinisphaera japonica]ROO26353.1 glycosyltransferase [Salinisphaera japonica YTM-1]